MTLSEQVQGAKAWAGKNFDGSEYESVFGEVVEDGSVVALNTTLSTAAYDKLRKMAGAAGTSLKAVLERLILEA